MSKTFSVAEVAEHKDAEKGMYIIVDENVYDVTGMFFFLSGGFWVSLF
jgi:cytochrome b involved in lipid metabolism